MTPRSRSDHATPRPRDPLGRPIGTVLAEPEVTGEPVETDEGVVVPVQQAVGLQVASTAWSAGRDAAGDRKDRP